MPTGLTVRTELAPLVSSSSIARSIRPGGRNGMFAYSSTTAPKSTRGVSWFPPPDVRSRRSYSSTACRAAASTAAVSVASSVGRSITSMPRSRASAAAGALSVVSTSESSRGLASAWSNVYSISGRPSSGRTHLFGNPLLPARARITPSVRMIVLSVAHMRRLDWKLCDRVRGMVCARRQPAHKKSTSNLAADGTCAIFQSDAGESQSAEQGCESCSLERDQRPEITSGSRRTKWLTR